MQTQNSSVRLATSAAVVAKGRALAARYEGRGRFTVASGSTVGLVNSVAAPAGERNPEHWLRDCRWSEYNGAMCAHVRAAARELARLDRFEARQLVTA